MHVPHHLDGAVLQIVQRRCALHLSAFGVAIRAEKTVLVVLLVVILRIAQPHVERIHVEHLSRLLTLLQAAMTKRIAGRLACNACLALLDERLGLRQILARYAANAADSVGDLRTTHLEESSPARMADAAVE